ncbi:shikimate dehydrogenase [Roseivirga sp. BDSF3-8]|uniref:shikimate dehydrogenase family protein n=1 Tax=Roseivirga sp. BDSF3-8 TaxID=3241598 RepID=UPI003531FFAF
MSASDKLIGLVGFPLGHSFSNRYFTEKFQKEGIEGFSHRNFEIQSVNDLSKLLSQEPRLIGLNVTIPLKQAIIPLLHELDSTAEEIGAVNTIRIRGGRLKGFNTDYYGFQESLKQWLGDKITCLNKALILGTGGASRAIKVALEDLDIVPQYVSRHPQENEMSYNSLKASPDLLHEYPLIINCTPLGTFPDIEQKPDIPYGSVSSNHWLYDLVYNPAETAFLNAGRKQGAQIKNGLQMLHLQADKSWEIWNGTI